MPQLEFSAGLLDDEPEDIPQNGGGPDEHPHDRAAYEVFALAMGWRPEWWELGTDRDIPGPGRLPFVLAFQKVREMMGCGNPHGGEVRKAVTVDHWAEWLKARERHRAERAKTKPKRRERRR